MKELFKSQETRIVNIKYESLYDVYIGRPSIWGNPYSHKDKTIAKYKVNSVQEALDKYREYLLGNAYLMSKLIHLKGKTLGCWCVPRNHKKTDDPTKYVCHGEILIELIDKL